MEIATFVCWLGQFGALPAVLFGARDGRRHRLIPRNRLIPEPTPAMQTTSAAIAAGAATGPANSQPIPLLTAANGEKSMRRAGQYGTG